MDKKTGQGLNLKGLAMLASMGMAMVLTTVMGLVTGLLLDRALGTGPWLMILFLILGVVAGFRNIYITMKKYGFKDLE